MMKKIIVAILLFLAVIVAQAQSTIAQDRITQRINDICTDERVAKSLVQWCARMKSRFPPIPHIPTEPEEPPPIEDEDGEAIALHPLEQGVIDLTNRVRRANGIPPVTHHEQLYQAAKNHAADMAANAFMSHTGSDGSTPAHRIQNAGYQYRTYGENIAYGYRTAESVMDAWMSSPGHRQNILTASFCHIGVAVAYRGAVPYWTQKFACRW